jgi:hypothetical protein
MRGMANIHTAAFYGRTCANRGTLDPIIGLLHHNNGGRSRRACGSLGTDSRLLRCGVLASTDVRLRVRDAHDPGARFQRRLRARGCGEEGVAGKSAGPTMLVILIGSSPLEIRRLFAELQGQGARGLLSGTRSRLFGARRGSGPAARPCRSGTVSAPIDAEFTVRWVRAAQSRGASRLDTDRTDADERGTQHRPSTPRHGLLKRE